LPIGQVDSKNCRLSSTKQSEKMIKANRRHLDCSSTSDRKCGITKNIIERFTICNLVLKYVYTITFFI